MYPGPRQIGANRQRFRLQVTSKQVTFTLARVLVMQYNFEGRAPFYWDP